MNKKLANRQPRSRGRNGKKNHSEFSSLLCNSRLTMDSTYHGWSLVRMDEPLSGYPVAQPSTNGVWCSIRTSSLVSSPRHPRNNNSATPPPFSHPREQVSPFDRRQGVNWMVSPTPQATPAPATSAAPGASPTSPVPAPSPPPPPLRPRV